jgi:hypothetical protein
MNVEYGRKVFENSKKLQIYKMKIQKEELGVTGKVILRPVQALGVANS